MIRILLAEGRKLEMMWEGGQTMCAGILSQYRALIDSGGLESSMSTFLHLADPK